MHFSKTFISLSLLVSLMACQDNNEPATASSSQHGTLKVVFEGKTKIYKDARVSLGKMGSIETISIIAGDSEKDYLTVTAFGKQAGTYPYKQDINDYENVGQVEYKTGGTVYNNWYTQICPDKNEYISTTGEVKLAEYTEGKHAKGTFSGALLDADSEDECHPTNKPFSGEFEVTMN